MNRYKRHGLVGTGETRQATVNVPIEDMKYILSLYDESGTQANLGGALLAHFADYLRSEGLKTIDDRLVHPQCCILTLAIDGFLKKSIDPAYHIPRPKGEDPHLT